MRIKVLLKRLASLACLAGVGAGLYWARAYSNNQRKVSEIEHLRKTVVARRDLSGSVRGAGTVESTKQTTIRCQIEKVNLSNQAAAANQRGSSTILWLAPDGKKVAKDELICKLDSSDFEEQAIQQRILVEVSKAAAVQAKLDLEIAEASLEEFKNGLDLQSRKDYEAIVKNAESNLDRWLDRLKWNRQMAKKGYTSEAQVKTDELTVLSAKIGLEQARDSHDLYKAFSSSRNLRTLEVDIAKAKANLEASVAILGKEKDKLEHLELQFERCKIKAPHDGLLVYANRPERNILIEEGLPVRQNMRLFYLPDLGAMDIETPIHESMIERIHVGQPAKIRFESLPDRVAEGHVDFVEAVPKSDLFFFSGNDVKKYNAMVRLDSVPDGVLPGMSSEVEIFTENKTGVLTIPVESMRVEAGSRVCYLVHEENLERREIKVGLIDEEFLEVESGVEEGDEVALDAEDAASRKDLFVASPDAPNKAADKPTPTLAILALLAI